MQTVSAFKKKIVTKVQPGDTNTPLDQRGALKIVKVNPSISIQPKKPGKETVLIIVEYLCASLESLVSSVP